MNKRLKYFEIAGVIFTTLVGSLLHFTYDWANQAFFVSLFSPVNESTWEHLKMLFFPYLVYGILELCFLGVNTKTFLCAKLAGCTAGLLTIVVLFYTYTGILGTNYLFFDITTFIVGVVISFIVSYLLTDRQKCCIPPGVTILLLCMLCMAFFIFTIFPPSIALFQSPEMIP